MVSDAHILSLPTKLTTCKWGAVGELLVLHRQACETPFRPFRPLILS